MGAKYPNISGLVLALAMSTHLNI